MPATEQTWRDAKLLHVVFGAYVAFFGAIVGVLYPPRSRTWAGLQKLAMALLAAALAAVGLTALAAWLAGWTQWLWLAALVAAALYLGFAVLGNVCRMRHEGR